MYPIKALTPMYGRILAKKSIVNPIIAQLMGYRANRMEWGKLPGTQKSILESLKSQSDKFNTRELTTAISCLTYLGIEQHSTTNVPKLLADHSLNLLEHFNQQELATILCALSKLAILQEDFINKSCQCLSKMASTLNEVACVQLYTAWTYYCLQDEDKWNNIEEQLPQGYFENIRQIARKALRNNSNSSFMHKEVSDIILAIRPDLRHTNETFIRCLLVDILIKSRYAAIEVNGPTHFTENGEFNMQTKRKHNLLDQLGYSMININYQQWDNLFALPAKKDYLSKLLPSKFDPKPGRLKI